MCRLVWEPRPRALEADQRMCDWAQLCNQRSHGALFVLVTMTWRLVQVHTSLVLCKTSLARVGSPVALASASRLWLPSRTSTVVHERRCHCLKPPPCHHMPQADQQRRRQRCNPSSSSSSGSSSPAQLILHLRRRQQRLPHNPWPRQRQRTRQGHGCSIEGLRAQGRGR